MSNEVGKPVRGGWGKGGEGNPVNQDCGRVEFVGIKGSPSMTVGTDIIDIGNMDIFVHFFMHTLTSPSWRTSFGGRFIRNVFPLGKSGWQSTPDSRDEGKRKPKKTPI